MSALRHKLAASFFVALIAFLVVYAAVGAEEEETVGKHRAVAVTVEGKVERQPAGSTEWSGLSAGQQLGIGDSIRTGEDGKVSVRIGDLGVFDVVPKTTVRLLDLARRRPRGAGDDKTVENIKLDLKKGTIRGLLMKPATGTGSYRIQTPINVVGVRGTTFKVTVGDVDDENPMNVWLLDGVLEILASLGDGEKTNLNPNQSYELVKGRPRVGPLSMEAARELKEFRERAKEVLSKRFPGDEAPAADTALVTESRFEDRSETDISGLLPAVADLFEAYERGQEARFLARVADDFRGQWNANNAATFLDKLRLRDSLHEDFRNFRLQEFEVNVRSLRRYTGGAFEVEADWRERQFLLGESAETRRAERRSRLRWRRDRDREWRLIWWDGDPLFALYNPLTGALADASSLCDVTFKNGVFGANGAPVFDSGTLVDQDVCITNATVNLNGSTLTMTRGSLVIENSTLNGPGTIQVNGTDVTMTGSTISRLTGWGGTADDMTLVNSHLVLNANLTFRQSGRFEMTGGTVFLNPGIDLTLRDNVSVSGVSVTGTLASGSDIAYVGTAGANFNGVTINGGTLSIGANASNVTVTGGSYAGGAGFAGIALFGPATSSITIDGATLTNSQSSGIGVSGAVSDVTIRNCQFVNNIANGIAFGNGAYSNWTISNSNFSNNPEDGISVVAAGSTFTNFTISGNTISSNTLHGFDFASFASTLTNFSMSNNTFSSNGRHGATFFLGAGAAGAVTSTGNTYRSNGAAGFAGLFGTGTLVNSTTDVFDRNNGATGICNEVNAGPGPVSDPAADPDDGGNQQWTNLNSRI